MNHVHFPEEWKRPFTNKRYLHPPLAQNMFTMWPDLRIICHDVKEIEHIQLSSGFRILVGETLEVPDYASVQYETRFDGAPIHSVRYDMGEFSIHMESFCNITRVPTAFTRITLTNNTNHPVEDVLGLMARTGREDLLLSNQIDGYSHLDTNVHVWGFIQNTWRLEDSLLSDDEYNIRLQLCDRIAPEWQGDEKGLVWAKRNLLKLRFTVLPGERVDFMCAMRHGEVSDFDYYEERKKTLDFWNGELKRLKMLPGGERYRDVVNNIIVQSLQMFAKPVGQNYVQARQGGLQRNIWPCEALELLTALDRVGDFYDYTEAAYETYFFTLQYKDGEDKGGIHKVISQFTWGSMTGGAVYGCATHLLYRNSMETYQKFADALYLGFEWMQRQRAKTLDGQYAAKGIFPPMPASDWGGNDQSTFTDSFNLMGYKALAEAFEKFNDPRAKEVREAYEDYLSCMKTAIDKEIAKNTLEDEIILTNKIGVDMPDPPTGPYMTDGPIALVRAGVLKPGCETIKLVENFFRNRGMMRNGLTGLMNDSLMNGGYATDSWAGHTWYTSMGDYMWFLNWMESGEREKAAETLFAQLQWGMTPEYYLLERYADNDPYWTPWLPNASANGRLLNMLADYFG